MSRITLEGSITPSTYLARGARITVERTSYVDKLIARGYVVVVSTPPAKEEIEQITASKLAAAKAEKRISRPRRPKAAPEPEPEPEPVVEDEPADG